MDVSAVPVASTAPAVPPGPRGVPLLGSLPSLGRDPLAFLTEVSREHGGIATYRLGHHVHWLITDPAAIEVVLIGLRRQTHKDETTNGLSRLLGQGLVTSEDPLWRRQRKLAAPSFRPSHLEAYGRAMVEAAVRGSEAVAPGPRDVHVDMTEVTLEIVLRTLFGSVDPAGAQVGEAIADFMEAFEEEVRSFRRLLPAWVPTRGRRRVAAARRTIAEVLDPIIARERASTTEHDHLLGRLLAARDADGEGMSDEQLRDEAITLFTAGHETTALVLSYALWLLAHHVPIQEQLVAEGRAVLGERLPTAADLPRLKLHQAVVRETMRLYPPAWAMGRTPIEDVEVCGHTIRVGEQIMIPQWVVHRDPRWWREPLAFRPERWMGPETEDLPRFAYFPFGGGPRICIGNHFAMLEAVLVLAVWLQRHCLVPVPGAQLELMPAVTLRPRSGVWLELSAR